MTKVRDFQAGMASGAGKWDRGGIHRCPEHSAGAGKGHKAEGSKAPPRHLRGVRWEPLPRAGPAWKSAWHRSLFRETFVSD